MQRLDKLIHFTSGFLFIFVSQFACAGSSPLYVDPSSNHHSSTSQPSLPSGRTQNGRIRSQFSGGKIIVKVFPLRNEGYIGLAVRISNQPKQWKKLKKWNRNLRFPRRNRPIRVPFDFLNAQYRVKAVKAVFPKDTFSSKGWKHHVIYPGETMWFIAETFTGDGANYPIVQKVNGLKKGEPLAIGQVITIPLNILNDEYSRILPQHPDLTFAKGRDGKLYAVYKLKKGEALYSAVVVRFTGRVEGKDVNEMANKIMRINGLRDPRKIPAGRKIRIPFELLSDDFATGGAPTHLVKTDRPSRGKRLYVILDPGHGGSDPGVVRNGLYEDELSYDIMLRVKKSLENKGISVFSTVYDPADNGVPKNSHKLGNGNKEFVKTTPPYRILDSRVSVNMRVYLINAFYQKLRRKGIPERNIIFISLHMDHLHPSMRGVMIYYPNENLRAKKFYASGRIYRKYRESKNTRLVFASYENRKASSYSYNFSKILVRSLKKKKVLVHSYRPIRPFVYRKNRKWIPAVIRYSKVPTSVLIEVVNMANRHDLANIGDFRFRERVAQAIVDAIL